MQFEQKYREIQPGPKPDSIGVDASLREIPVFKGKTEAIGLSMISVFRIEKDMWVDSEVMSMSESNKGSRIYQIALIFDCTSSKQKKKMLDDKKAVSSLVMADDGR